MPQLLDYLASAVICPIAVLHIFLLNDRWRVAPVWRWLLFLLCGPLSAWLAELLVTVPIPLRVTLIWIPELACLWGFSAVRDTRFLFTAATGVMFTYLSTVVCSMLSLPLGIHRLLLRMVFDGFLLIVGMRLFRSVFMEVYHALKKGWLVFSFMPIALAGVFFSLLMTPDYQARYAISYVRGFTYLLAILTLVFYCASFYFFRKLSLWQKGELDSAVLYAQITAQRARSADRLAEEERARILRHDLRHYLRILSASLREEDSATAQRTLESLDAHMSRSPTPARKGDGV